MSKKSSECKYGSGGKAPGAHSEMTRFYWILGVVAVLGVGIVGYSVGSKAMSTTVSAPIPMPGLDDPTKLMDVARGVVKGNADAPFTIIEFADFQCPACGQFAVSEKPLIEAEFVATGKAKFVYYDFPLVSVHNHAFLAARAARCAEDQQKFWEYHDVLYRNQPRWSGSTNPAGLFENYASEIGLAAGEFSDCLKSDKHADVITANMELGYQVQVPGTPTLMLTQGLGVGRKVSSTTAAIREAIRLMEGEGASSGTAPSSPTDR